MSELSVKVQEIMIGCGDFVVVGLFRIHTTMNSCLNDDNIVVMLW